MLIKCILLVLANYKLPYWSCNPAISQVIPKYLQIYFIYPSLSIYPSIYLYLSANLYTNIFIYIDLSINQSIFQSINLSVYLFIYLSKGLSINQSIYLSLIFPSIQLSLFIYLSLQYVYLHHQLRARRALMLLIMFRWDFENQKGIIADIQSLLR